MNETTNLSDAEQRVISSAKLGEPCDFGEGDPAQGGNWGEERTVSAHVIYALCCATREDWPVHAKGVHIRGARVVGTLDFEAAILRCPLHLLSCFIEEPMRFDEARVRSLALSGSFTQGLLADGMVSEGSVRLDKGFSAKGTVRLLGARIDGNLVCQGGSFENPEGDALSADRLNCKGSVFLRNGFSAKGAVRLLGAMIGSNLDCRRGSFENPEGSALSTDGLDCKGGVSLSKDFSAKGEVRLVGARIGGNLECDGGTFKNPDGKALSAERLDCKGHVFLSEGFSAKGAVRLLGATIRGGVDCSQGSFENPGGDAFDLYTATVAGTLVWSQLQSPPPGLVDLIGAQVGALEDDRESWPEQGSLLLVGFRYARIEPMDAEMRKQWLAKAPYSAQPYEQLATVLRNHGHQEEAKKILMAGQRARVRYGSDPWFVKLWTRFLGRTIGYGFRPGRAVLGLIVLWLVGLGVFSYAERHAIMAPSDVNVMRTDSWTQNQQLPLEYRDYPRFIPITYSLDTMVPIVNLHMESYWEPSLRNGGALAWIAWLYLRLHILLGWILTTLAVLGFAGLVRQDRRELP